MCQPVKTIRQPDVQSCTPCDCGCMPPFRRYYTAEEEREHLETYREQLRKELAGVEERIGGFKS